VRGGAAGIWLDMNEISNYCTGDVCSDPGAPLPRHLSLAQALGECVRAYAPTFFLPSGRRGVRCSGCAQGGAAAADARPRAGGVYARNDFVCMLNCDMGPDAGRNTTRPANLTLPAAGIFNPPYAINSGNREVRAARRDMAQAHKRTVRVCASGSGAKHGLMRWRCRARPQALHARRYWVVLVMSVF